MAIAASTESRTGWLSSRGGFEQESNAGQLDDPSLRRILLREWQELSGLSGVAPLITRAPTL